MADTPTGGSTGGPSEGTDGEGAIRREGGLGELRPEGGQSDSSGERDVTTGVTAGGSGGGTAGTGGFEVGPGPGAGPGAAGVASSGRDDTGGLTIGDNADNSAGGEARDGQEIANELGGHGPEGRATGAGLTGAGSATGDASAMRSESGAGDGLGGIDAGSPGGMGGVRASGGTGTGRPPGGLSPLANDPHAGESRD
jgi:hypothetical protein